MLFTISCSTFYIYAYNLRNVGRTATTQNNRCTLQPCLPFYKTNYPWLDICMHCAAHSPLLYVFYMSSVCLCIKNNYLDACICANYNYLSTFVPALSVQIFCDFICQQFILLIIRPYFARIAEIDKMSFPLFSA